MSGLIKSLSFVFLMMVLFCPRTSAQTIKAASCNEGDVAAALNSITTDGATVNVPVGNCTWTTPLSYTQIKSFTLQCAGAESSGYPSTTPVGTDQTIIQDNINRSSSDNPLLGITLISGKSFRLTGCAFQNSSSNSTQTFNGSLRISGVSTSCRIDHNHLNSLNLIFLAVSGWVEGVFDHNQMDLLYSDSNGVRVGDQAWNNETGSGGPVGNNSWADNSYFGSSQFFFMENNTFNWIGATSNPGSNFAAVNDCNAGGRFVFRYNLVAGILYVQTHEMEGDFRGCRAMEVYQNTAIVSTSPATNFSFFVQSRMGTGLVWGNTLTGYQQVTNFAQDRTNVGAGEPHPFPVPPNNWGYCGTVTAIAEGQIASPWDQNPIAPYGYACVDQIGRGKGQLLTGYFPNKINSATGTMAWPNNAQEPYYLWENTFNARTGANGYATTNDPMTILENRDYYLELPNFSESATFNGTVGIGEGLLALRPSTCTPMTAYWATDTSTLYQCATANTWTAYYTPYTYPHPLTTGSQSSGTPAAPSNLAATVSN
jgi:hypothetical protein